MTESQANTWLADFEERNSDLPKRVRRILGLFKLAADRKVPRYVIDNILGYESSVFHRDISRRWWLILYHSGLGKYWKRFAHLAETQGLPSAWEWLLEQVPKKKRDLVLRRLGSVLQCRQIHRSRGLPQVRWFKAGTWYTSSAWARLLIEGKSLASRREYNRPLYKKVRPYARLLERECYHRIDPDEVTPPAAMHDTVSYVRRRLAEITKRHVSLEVAAWFLTVDIPKGRRISGRYYRILPKPPPGAIGQEAKLGARKLARMWR